MKLTDQTNSISRESALRDRQWMVIDASERALGRVASRAASLLTGKKRPDYTPNQDTGDFVVVINAAKVRLTGKKLGKVYYRHTGCRAASAPRRRARSSNGEAAATGGNRGARDAAEESPRPADLQQAEGIRGAEHPHTAQKPKGVSVE